MKGDLVAKKPELDESGGRKKEPAGPGKVPEAETKKDVPREFETAKDGKANNKEQSGQRWWARWRS